MTQPTSNHPRVRGNPLHYGLEFEVPFTSDENPQFTGRGRPTTREDTDWFCVDDAEMDYEWISASPSTYGWEARTTDTMTRDGLQEWYQEVYDAIQYHAGQIEPCGYHGDGTAGLHVHVSPLSEQQAEMIYEISAEPWMRLLACTSVAAFDHHGERLPKYHVLRGEDPDVKNPCPQKKPSGFGKARAIAQRSGTGHYEWRLPEPMLPVSFRRLMEVLTVALRDGREEAEQLARTILNERPMEVTAIRRARAIQAHEGDLPEMKEEQNATTDLLLEVM